MRAIKETRKKRERRKRLVLKASNQNSICRKRLSGDAKAQRGARRYGIQTNPTDGLTDGLTDELNDGLMNGLTDGLMD